VSGQRCRCKSKGDVPTYLITLPRSKLHELVWSKPIAQLAEEFGISDVALGLPTERFAN
jgi:hypothetical protein